MNVTSGIGSAAQALNVVFYGFEQCSRGSEADEQWRVGCCGSTERCRESDGGGRIADAGSLGRGIRVPGRLRRCRRRLRQGTYNVSASAVADKLIQSMLG